MADSKKSREHLVWIDCEMTGLDPGRHVLLEIASIVTDYDLNVVAAGPTLAIRPSRAKLAAMDGWSKNTHGRSGLLDRVRTEGVSVAEAERQTLAFVRRHCYVRTAPLCGNSIWQDKRFLTMFMPRLQAFLHYRIIDVSSLKLLAAHWYAGTFRPPVKQERHLAQADIEDSIQELRYYRSLFAHGHPAREI